MHGSRHNRDNETEPARGNLPQPTLPWVAEWMHLGRVAGETGNLSSCKMLPQRAKLRRALICL